MTPVTQRSTEVRKRPFGKMPDGEEVNVYTMQSPAITASVLNYGGILSSLIAEDRDGAREDVVLGYDSFDGYLQDTYFHGASIGRFANRIGKGEFSLDGTRYFLEQNNNSNALHGGPFGFCKRLWHAKAIDQGVELTYTSPDGEQGFPGTLVAIVRYQLIERDLQIEYLATTDKPTVVNLTNHAYFNLAGQGCGNILDHELKINASAYTPINVHLIPTGEIAGVAGTPLDFREAQPIGARINARHQQLALAGGYDFNWVLDPLNGGVFAAEAHDPKSGRILQVLTDQPGLQFYSGNFLTGAAGKQGQSYHWRSGFCLETQHFPDSPNHPHFPSTVLRPGEHYHSVTRYRFLTR